MGYSFGHRWSKAEDALFESDLSNADIARQVGVSEPAARSRRNRLDGKTYHVDAEDRSSLLKLVKQTAWQERVLDAVREAASKPLRPLPKVALKKAGEREHALQFSDLQFGEHLTASQSAGLARYDSALAEQRVAMLAQKVIAIQQRDRVKRLNVWMEGDLVEGTTIYASQSFYVDSNVVTQTVKGGRVVAQFIRTVAPYYDEVVVDGVLGNHGRIGREMPVNANMDLLLMHYAEALVADIKNVRTRVHDKTFYSVVERFGRRYLLVHGDDVQMSLTGFKTAVRKWRDLVGRVDVVLIGHHHVSVVTPTLIINGSFVGPSEYSLKTMGESSHAIQNLLTISAAGIESVQQLSLETEVRRAKVFSD